LAAVAAVVRASSVASTLASAAARRAMSGLEISALGMLALTSSASFCAV
jgi:hypothetical protein